MGRGPPFDSPGQLVLYTSVMSIDAEMVPFYWFLIATLGFNAFVLGFLIWAFHSKRYMPHRFRKALVMKVSKRARVINMSSNLVLSLVCILGLVYVLEPYVLHLEATPVWRIVGEGVAVLLVYDFAYYFMHRAMHNKKAMRWVHGVHHRARYPTALESLYLSPVELVLGLALLMAATWVVGPVHAYAFSGVFVVHSSLNLIVHSGIDFPSPLMRPLNYLARKHHEHHYNEYGRNYASLTPLPDRLFGTAT